MLFLFVSFCVHFEWRQDIIGPVGLGFYHDQVRGKDQKQGGRAIKTVS